MLLGCTAINFDEESDKNPEETKSIKILSYQFPTNFYQSVDH